MTHRPVFKAWEGQTLDGFSGFNWIKDAPEAIEKAISLCAGIKADSVADYTYALRYFEPEIPHRHDLAVILWHEIYARRTPCWIYFARAGNVVKVGRSIQVAARLTSLDKQHDVKHELLGTVRGDYREENRLHWRFRQHRVKAVNAREYFWYEPIAEIINDILVAGEALDAPLGRIAA